MLNIIYISVCIIVTAICLWTTQVLRKEDITWMSYLKYFIGCPIGVAISFLLSPISVSNIILFAVIGSMLSTLLSLFLISVKQTYNKNTVIPYYDDGSPAKFFITGDKHRNFENVKEFCREMNTRRKDVLIILGDAGFNYFDDKRDDKLKKEISDLNITLFCLHGNKENRPQNVGTYGIRSFCDGKVYYEPKYPNIYFAIDGEIYNFEGRKYMVVGGAHSVDKIRCLEDELPFWYDEMPDNTIKNKVEEKLLNEGNEIFGMMTHTCPIDYLPTEMFMSTKQNMIIKRKPYKAKSKKLFKPDIDRSTEIWLGKLEKNLKYEVWFCGHYHIDKQIDKIHMMFHDICPLHTKLLENEQYIFL